jgi:hypothetical protein
MVLLAGCSSLMEKRGHGRPEDGLVILLVAVAACAPPYRQIDDPKYHTKFPIFSISHNEFLLCLYLWWSDFLFILWCFTFFV